MAAESGASGHIGSRERISKAQWQIIVICTLVYLLDGLVHSVLGPIAPQMAGELRLTPPELGSVFSANLIGQSIGLIVFPLLAARIGNRAVVLIAATGFGTFELASGFSPDGDTMFFIRLATGIFLGGALPTCLAIVTAASPVARRGIVIMILFTGYGTGATLAGFAVPVFGEDGWRTALIAVGICSLLTAATVWAGLHPPEEDTRSDALAEPAAAPSQWALFSRRYLLGTILLWLLFLCMLTISYCLNSWLPTLLVEVGHGASMASMSVTTFSFGGIVAALLVGLLIDRFGSTPVLCSFLGLSAALLLAVGMALDTMSSGPLLALLAVTGFFVLGSYGGVNVVLASYYPANLRAIGVGWTKSVSRVGTVIAPILIGFALARGTSEATVMTLFAVPAVLAMLAVLFVGLAMRRQASPTGQV